MSGASDFNDLHETEGLRRVKAQLREAQAPPEEPQPDPEQPAPDRQWRKRLVRNDKGAVKACIANVRTVLQNDPKWSGVLGYCEFSYRIVKRKPPPFETAVTGEWNDGDTARLRIWLSDRYGFTPSVGDALDGVLVVAQRGGFHPVREYLETLQWDGIERLAHWLRDYLGALAPPEYLRIVGTKFLIGAVARIYDPGCKMDNVLIFEGAQGSGKSSSIQALFLDWFSDAPMRLNDKDAYQNIQGVWCVELAELDSLNKAESTEAKSFFSQRRDRYRPSYGRCAQDFPRQCVFVGTTNQDQYLKDDTGNRRYWPVRCLDVTVEALAAARDQLFAEALCRYREGVPWWVLREEAALFEEEQDKRRMEDPWEFPVMHWLHAVNAEFVTSAQVLKEACGKPLMLQLRADQNRIAPLVKALGWEHVRQWSPDEKRKVWCFRNPKVQNGKFYE